MAAVAIPPAAESVPALELETVLYEKRDGIAYVTVNRPKVLNALNRTIRHWHAVTLASILARSSCTI